MIRLPRVRITWCTVLLCLVPAGLHGQAEVTAWGNLEGIRVEGHRFDFETGVCLNRADGSELNRTSKERQRPRYQSRSVRPPCSHTPELSCHRRKLAREGAWRSSNVVDSQVRHDCTAAGRLSCRRLGGTAQRSDERRPARCQSCRTGLPPASF